MAEHPQHSVYFCFHYHIHTNTNRLSFQLAKRAIWPIGTIAFGSPNKINSTRQRVSLVETGDKIALSMEINKDQHKSTEIDSTI